jgi:paraquat-inducible protein B
MAKKKTYKMVGLFVVLGFACLGGIIFNYASKQFFSEDKEYVVMYFEETIQGLSVGSSVVFKGVEVGQVAKINLLMDVQTGKFKTPVFIKFQENKSFRLIDKQHMDPEETIKVLVEKGLRARLVSASLLTGQLMIELNMDPSSPAKFEGDGSHIEIPTEMSPFEMISKDLQEIPLKETMLRLSDIVQKIDMQLPDILQNFNERMPKILENIQQVTQKASSTIDKKSYETSKAMTNFNSTMEDMGKASISIKNLADYLERHPEALLRGKEENQ